MRTPSLIVALAMLSTLCFGQLVLKHKSTGSSTYVTFFAAHECTSSPTTCAATRNTGTIPSGHLIVATVFNYLASSAANACQAMSVQDSSSASTYTPSPEGCITVEDGGSKYYGMEHFYAISTGAGGGSTVTATLAGSAPYVFVSAEEWSYTGIPTVTAYAGGSTPGVATATSVTTGTMVITNANVLITASGGQAAGAAWTAGGDGGTGTYTIRTQDNYLAQQDIVEASAGTFSSTMNTSPASNIVSVATAFHF